LNFAEDYRRVFLSEFFTASGIFFGFLSTAVFGVRCAL
jgi:hypothetical protein